MLDLTDLDHTTGNEAATKLAAKKQLVGQPDQPDIPGEPGSVEAKAAWEKISTQAHSPEMVAKAKAITGSEKATGMYMGKPLVPGEAGPGQGDALFLKHKLMYTKGFSPETAEKIIGSIKQKLYGNK